MYLQAILSISYAIKIFWRAWYESFYWKAQQSFLEFICVGVINKTSKPKLKYEPGSINQGGWEDSPAEAKLLGILQWRSKIVQRKV